MDKGTAYLNIFLVKELNQSLKLLDLLTNEINYFGTLKDVTRFIVDKTGNCSYTGLDWSYKNKKAYKKRFMVEKVNGA